MHRGRKYRNLVNIFSNMRTVSIKLSLFGFQFFHFYALHDVVNSYMLLLLLNLDLIVFIT